MIRKLVCLWFLFLCFTSGVVFAGQYQAGIKVNQSAVGLDFGYSGKTDYGALFAGGDFLYKNDNDDKYNVLRGKTYFTTDPLLPGLRYGIGFEGMFGTIKDERQGRKGDLLALGFLFHMGYNHLASKSKIPADFVVELCMAPNPLTVKEADVYWGGLASIEFGILNNASISLEYRYMNIDFNIKGNEWDVSEGVFLIGYTIRF